MHCAGNNLRDFCNMDKKTVLKTIIGRLLDLSSKKNSRQKNSSKIYIFRWITSKQNGEDTTQLLSF